MSTSTNLNCYHCGTLVSKPDAYVFNTHQFCCAGCLTVYEFLTQNNLEAYYSLKDKVAPNAQREPVSFSKDNFKALDEDVLKNGELCFFLEGVHCAACIWLVEKVKDHVPGVTEARLDLGRQLAYFKLSQAKASDVAKVLSRLGYTPHTVENNQKELFIRANRSALLRLGIAGACMGNIMMMSVAIYGGATGHIAHLFNWVSVVLSLPVIFYCALPFYKQALASFKAKHFTIDVPLALGIVGASGVSFINVMQGRDVVYFDSIAMLVFLILSTRYLLQKIHQWAQDLSLNPWIFPKTASVWNPSTQSFIPVLASKIAIGDTVCVAVDELIPVDGVVIQGESWLDVASITGESQPQLVKRESFVFAGTRNTHSELHIKAIQTQEASRLSETLKQAQSQQRPALVSLSDFWASVLVSVVLVISAGILIWGWYFNAGYQAFDRVLALLVVTCPCALGVAVPLTLTLAMKKASKHHVLVKNPDVFEKLTQIQTVIVDKTGTLTTGTLDVKQWTPILPHRFSDHFILSMVFSLEEVSHHPIAQALRRFCLTQQANTIELQNRVEKIGVGVFADYEGLHYALKQLNETEESSPQTQIALYVQEQVVAVFYLEDTLRQDSKEVIDFFKQNKISTLLVSGDSSGVVKAVAKQLRLHDWVANAMPDDKLKWVNANPKALFVGDGANDAAALKAAWVGIAVQGSLEMSWKAADACLISSGLKPIQHSVTLSHSALHIIKRNLWLSVVYNVLFGGLAIGGYITPLWAAVFMPLSSLTVVISSLMWPKIKDVL